MGSGKANRFTFANHSFSPEQLLTDYANMQCLSYLLRILLFGKEAMVIDFGKFFVK